MKLIRWLMGSADQERLALIAKREAIRQEMELHPWERGEIPFEQPPISEVAARMRAREKVQKFRKRENRSNPAADQSQEDRTG